jgi:hypothetical protein
MDLSQISRVRRNIPAGDEASLNGPQPTIPRLGSCF